MTTLTHRTVQSSNPPTPTTFSEGAFAELMSVPWPGLAGYPQDPTSLSFQMLSRPTVCYPEPLLVAGSTDRGSMLVNLSRGGCALLESSKLCI